MAKKLFVGGLPWSVTDNELRDMFAEQGEVISASVLMDRETGRSRGFGFVEMSSDEDAEKAIKMLNNSKVGERQIVVNEAKPREERRDNMYSTQNNRYDNRRGGGGGYNRGGGNRGSYNRH